MKKTRMLALLLTLCMFCALLSGCGQSYTVSLNENYPGGSTTEISTSSAKEIAAQTPVREGYVFEGWFKDENLTEAWDAAADKVKSDLTLYAAWDKDTGDAIQDPGNDKDFRACARRAVRRRPMPMTCSSSRRSTAPASPSWATPCPTMRTASITSTT